MITGKGGKGGNDAELLIGATIDGAGLQKSWDEAFKGLKTPELVSKKATESGKKLLNSVLPKDAVAAVNRQITELEGRIKDFQKLQEKLTASKDGKLKGADGKDLDKFLKPFTALTEGLGNNHLKLERVGQQLQGDVNNLGKLYKSIADLNRNVPTTRKEIDLFAGLTDKGKLQQSAANIRKAQDQLAQQKQLIADLAKVHKAALAAGQTDFARVLGGQIGLQQSQYTKDRAAVDLIAAQKRVDQELRSNANASAKERARESKERVKAQQKQDAEELAAQEKSQKALLTSQAKYQQIRRENAAGVAALKTLPNAPGLDLTRVTREGASTRVSELQAAVKLLGELEKRYSAMATQQQAAGKNNTRAVQAQLDVAKAAEGYRAELEKINGAIKHNRDALAEQKRLGRDMAKDVEKEIAAREAGNRKLSEMDRAAMAAQAQRARRRDAEMAKIRRANQVDPLAVSQVHAGTSALTLAEQAAAISKSIALNKALVAQYDKVILAEQALGKQTAAMEAVRAREAAVLDKNIKKHDELTAAIKNQTVAQAEADRKAKKISDFQQQRISGQATRDTRYRYEKSAAEDRLFDRRRGVGPNLKGTVDELRLQNTELDKAAKWHEKMAQALVQEEGRAKNLGVAYSHISRELSNHVLAIDRIAKEQEQVNKALREQERLERQSLKIKQDLAAKIQSNIAGNREGNKIVAARGGYSNFNANGLNLKEAKLASEALNQMAAAMKNNLQQQAALGQATQKMRDNLDRVSNSARHAKEVLATLQKEAASAHGLQRFNQELMSTIKNFAKFAVVYQGLYAVLSYVRGLTGAVFDLNKELANMQAITAESSKSMQEISTAILQTASNSRYTMSEMTEAAKVIAQAGKSAEELPKVLQAVSDFSSGTDTSLATSADIITSVGEVYKDLSDADIANQLTKAVNISKLNGEDLKTILSIGAQVGEGYNITSEQMLAAASALRNAGIKASTIATGLRQAMVEVFNLQDNSVKALQEQYAKIGQGLTGEEIKAKFFNFSKEADPLLAVLRELKTLGFGAGGDFTLGRAFDIRALNVLKALSTNTESYLKLQKEVNFGQPAADAAATSMQSLSAQMTRFNNILTGILNQPVGGFFSELAKHLKDLNDYLEKRKQLREEELSKRGESTNPELSTTDKVLGYGKQAFFGLAKLGVFGSTAANAAWSNPSSDLSQRVSDTQAQQYGQSTLAVANRKLDELQARIEAYDPTSPDRGLGKFVAEYEQTLNSVAENLEKLYDSDKVNREQLIDLLNQYNAEADSGKRKEILAQLAQMSKDASQVTDESITEIANQVDSLQASSQAAVDNFKSLYAGLQKKVEEGGDGAAQAAQQLQILTTGENAELTRQLLRGGFGKYRPSANVETFQKLAKDISQVTKDELAAAIKAKADAMEQAFKNDLAVAAATPNGGAEAAVEAVINQYVNSLSSMGADAAAPIFASLQNIAAKELSVGGSVSTLFKTSGGSVGNLVNNVGIPGVVGQGGGVFPIPSGKNVFVDTQKQIADDKARIAAEKQAEYDKTHQIQKAKLSERVYTADPALGAKAAELDFGITQLQKFGDAAGSAAGMIQEKNTILAQMKNQEIETAQYNLEVAKQHGTASAEYKKAAAELASQQLDLQKIELQGKEEYLDNMQKAAVREMGMYDQQKDSILAAGGSYEGLAELNNQYVSTQQNLISGMSEYMRTALRMSEEDIKRYIESRPELQRGLLTDKDINSADKKHSAMLKAASDAVPTSATTGNALLDAKARAGLGFTQREEAQFAADKYSAIGNEIAVNQKVIAAKEAQLAIAKAGNESEQQQAQVEQLTAMIEQRTSAIRELEIAQQDLAAQTEEFASTAASELASVFNADGIRFFTNALQESGNSLKDWGDNIRDSLVTAWDSVGDAIASAVLDGEDFVESLKEIARTMARDVFTMTTKNMMNNLFLGATTGTYGGIVANALPGAAGTTPAGAPAAPASGGLLSSIGAAIGLTPAAATGAPGAAGSAVGTMTVNAGVVNVNGSTAGGAASTAEGLLGKSKELVGQPAPEKSLFQTVEDKISSGMDSVMGTLESAFKGLDAGLGGLLSGIGNIASDMFKGVADFDWGGMATKALSIFGMATGGIIPMKFAGGYVSKSGMIKGPGSGTSDSIRGSMYTKSGRAPIAVSSGESILTAKATSMLGEKTIKSLNAGTARKFSTGGMVARDRTNANSASLKTQSPSVTVNPAAPQSIQMINAIDSDSVVQAGLSSPASVKTLVNVIKANKSAFKSVLN